MTAMTSFQNKLSSLENRVKAANEASRNDKYARDLNCDQPSPTVRDSAQRPRNLTLGATGVTTKATRPTIVPLMTGSKKPKPINLGLQKVVSRPSKAEDDSVQAELAKIKLQEIMKQANVLTIENEKYLTSSDQLVLLGSLGHGTCGHVVKMKHTQSETLMAVKQMFRSGNKEENKRIMMDLDVVLKCSDSHIVHCFGYFMTDSEVWICMELMSTCLDKLLKLTKAPFPEHILGKVTSSVVRALHYLKEEHGVIHRDVKPSNILLNEKGIIKLCDFGISGCLVDSKAWTRQAGCAAYMAPERIALSDGSDYDIRADVWSLGITLVELATGKFPYANCKTDFEVLTNIMDYESPRLPENMKFTSLFRSFVNDCLMKDYMQRPKYKKLLTHPFISFYEHADVDVAAWYAEIRTIKPKPQRSQIQAVLSVFKWK